MTKKKVMVLRPRKRILLPHRNLFRVRNKHNEELGLVADPVIEAIARLEFEDGLRTGVLPGGCWGP